MHDANDEVYVLFLCKNIFLKKKKYYQTAPRKTDSVNHKLPHRAIIPIPLIYLLFKITSKNSITTVIDMNTICFV